MVLVSSGAVAAGKGALGINGRPATANPGQENADSDALGDVCDPCPYDANDDQDGDGICGDLDNS